jgi:hypothetical protein
MKKFLLCCFLILGLFLIGSLSGLHSKEINAVPGDVKKVRSYDIDDYGKAVLFEDKTYKTFGVASLEKKFGFLYQYDGEIEEGKPFRASGIGDNKCRISLGSLFSGGVSSRLEKRFSFPPK